MRLKFFEGLRCCSNIKKFSCRDDLHDMAQTNQWISNALERGVLDLDLCIKTTWICQPPRPLPSVVFTSKTLVKLTLGTELLYRKEISKSVSSTAKISLPRYSLRYKVHFFLLHASRLSSAWVISLKLHLHQPRRRSTRTRHYIPQNHLKTHNSLKVATSQFWHTEPRLLWWH